MNLLICGLNSLQLNNNNLIHILEINYCFNNLLIRSNELLLKIDKWVNHFWIILLRVNTINRFSKSSTDSNCNELLSIQLSITRKKRNSMSYQNSNQFCAKIYLILFLLLSFNLISIATHSRLAFGGFLAGIFIGLGAKDLHAEHEAY